MTNIKNYNFTGIDFKISNSEYYDFFLNTDGREYDSSNTQPLISSFNFTSFNEGQDINQVSNETPWVGAVSTNFSASTYGLTGLDNGKITYSAGSDNFLNKLTGTTLNIASADTNFTLNQVTGYTENHVYPISVGTGSTSNHLNFCGGFYQGYYKLHGHDYQVLPTRYQKGWTISVELKRDENVCSGTTGTTLNDTYPNNKGFFFYNGTRAENKFWNIFTGNTTGCTSGSTDFCMDVKETDVNVNNIMVEGSGTTVSVPLSPPIVDVDLIKNNFLIFGRSDGLLCSNEESADGFGQVRADRNYQREPFYSTIVRQVPSLSTNPFLVFGRSDGILCSNEESSDGLGQVRADRDFSGTTEPVTEIDKNADIVDNAIGFRIKDDGSIGYRLLTLSANCKTVEVVEEYSVSGAVTPNEWQRITVKWVNDDTYTECDLVNGDRRRGKYKFYVNEYLIFTSKTLYEFVPRELDDFMEKQLGVPYNISVGGGTQGLLESITFDGQDPDDLGLIIEENFAGSFIGSIRSFDFYDEPLSWCGVKEINNPDSQGIFSSEFNNIFI
jgi:hypothetical protein